MARRRHAKFSEWATYLLRIMVHGMIEIKENLLAYQSVYNPFVVPKLSFIFCAKRVRNFELIGCVTVKIYVAKSLYVFCLF